MSRLTGKLRWLAGSYILLCTLMVTLVIAAIVIDCVSVLSREVRRPTEMANIPYYQDKPWASEFIKDHKRATATRIRYVPFTLWRRGRFQSSSVNMDVDGRRVVPASSSDPAALKVCFFGGSCMWGVSSPDWATIPNRVVELSQGKCPRPINAENFGEPSWVSTQSLFELEQQLRRGRRPQIVVFYEGSNDVLMALTNSTAHEHGGLVRMANILNAHGVRRLKGLCQIPRPATVARSLLPNTFMFLDDSEQHRRRPHGWSDEQLADLADAMVAVYTTNQEIARSLAQRYGFEVRFYWQPHLRYDRKPASAAEVAIDDPESDPSKQYRRFARLVNDRVAMIQADDFRDLSSAFAGLTQQIYTDPVHVTPEGNEVIAAAIVDDLQRNSPAYQGSQSPASHGTSGQ